MVELPTGTVTLLFTDIEGSTKLLEELGRERYAEALARHRDILRMPSQPAAATRSTPPPDLTTENPAGAGLSSGCGARIRTLTT
jgi:hypothetical protein